MRWFLEVVSLELRRLAQSRVEFWSRIAISIVIQALIGYYLWSAVLSAPNQSANNTIGGYTLWGIVVYYVMATIVINYITPDFDLIAREIYDGGLNRFIIYPVSIFIFKFASVVARGILCSGQIIFVWGVLKIFLEDPNQLNYPFSGLILGLLSCFIAAASFFIIVCAIELIGFWIENAWNVRLILAFLLNILSGYAIPITAFPPWLRMAVEYTPFPWLIALPTRALLGEASFNEFAHGTLILAIWSLAVSCAVRVLWQRGRLRYTGVGL